MTWDREPVDFEGRQLATNELVASYELSELHIEGPRFSTFLDGAGDREELLENITRYIRVALLADLGLGIELAASDIGRGSSPPVAVDGSAGTSPPPECSFLGAQAGDFVALAVARVEKRIGQSPPADPGAA